MELKLPCNTQSSILITLRNKAFENIVGKGENAGNQRFLLFSLCFLTWQEQILSFGPSLINHLQMLSVWASPKFGCLVHS